MARPLRIQYPGAIYHAIARGNNRQDIFLDEEDRERYLARLEATVHRFGWEMLSFVLMTNHTHQFFRTPQANLSTGMQFLLSGYANWFQHKHGRCGHVFEGRFKGEVIEDESYFWVVSRYIHLNPLRTRVPLVEQLVDWPWSSYPGFADPSRRLDWVSYDRIYQAWEGTYGGDPVSSYVSFVHQGVIDPPESPFAEAIDDWILGSEKFVEWLKSQVDPSAPISEIPQARRFLQLELPELLEQVTGFYEITDLPVLRRGSRHRSRAVFAWLARRHTRSTRRTLAEFLGLSHPDSVSTLINKVHQQLCEPSQIQRDIEQLSQRLLAPRQEPIFVR